MHLDAVNENDILVAQKPDASGKLVMKVAVNNHEQLGGAFDKSKVKVLTSLDGGDSGLLLNVIAKEVLEYNYSEVFGDEKVDQTPAERYYFRWKYLKSIGVPVVSSMRVTDYKHIVMGNMTNDGSEFVDK